MHEMRSSGAQNGGRVAGIRLACQERVNKLAGNRPLREVPCSLSEICGAVAAVLRGRTPGGRDDLPTRVGQRPVVRFAVKNREHGSGRRRDVELALPGRGFAITRNPLDVQFRSGAWPR